MNKTTDLTFLRRLLEAEGYGVHLEYQFAKSLGRLWRFDLAILGASPIALEVDGGLFVGGAHARGGYIIKSHEKENVAHLLGWSILKCQPRDVKSGKAYTLLKAALYDKDREVYLKGIAKP